MTNYPEVRPEDVRPGLYWAEYQVTDSKSVVEPVEITESITGLRSGGVSPYRVHGTFRTRAFATDAYRRFWGPIAKP